MSYINRNRARQTGTNRTTQAEISNTFWLGFPGRVTGQNLQPPAAEFSGAGQWLSLELHRYNPPR
jgi:hypothetical protein